MLKVCLTFPEIVKGVVRQSFNPLNANPEKWSNTLKQIVGNLPTICLSVFDHFMNLALKGLMFSINKSRIASKIDAFYLLYTGHTLNIHETYVLLVYVLCQRAKLRISYNLDFSY